MASTTVVGIDMEDPADIVVATVDSGLLPRLTDSSLRWCFTGVHVSAGLQPDTQPLVSVEQYTGRGDHHSRSGDMHEIG